MFRLTKIEGGRINVFEPLMYTVGSSAVKAGQALVLNSGVLAAPSTAKPTFIALADAEPNTEVAVGRIEPNQIYEVKGVSDVTVGGTYIVTANGLGVGTALSLSQNGGGVEVVDFDATSGTALVRFIANDRT